ncbi:MAG: acyl-[acyl-carrier-protein] thioesterase [Chordicoccus sp.]
MYEFTSKVRYSEIGPDERMTLRCIATRMQDAAVFHSDMIGQGPAVWGKDRKIWMIISWQILVHERPLFGTNVTTRTWTYSFRGFNGFRNFVMEDENGKRLAEANTQWVYFDVNEQRPARVPKEQIEQYGIEPELMIPDKAPRRIPIPEDGAEGVIREEMPPFEIQISSIDTNRHVNNLAYIDMADNCLPLGMKVKELRVEYMKQARLGDTITPVTYRTDQYFMVCLNDGQGSPCAIIQFML